ncbi:hypothetical protein BT93_D2213 [Corymbia citriodora subsp. variegata]|nr:hypothetical protein BT93_D2213 [Corymbia citriodora subsp. variegata]
MADFLLGKILEVIGIGNELQLLVGHWRIVDSVRVVHGHTRAFLKEVDSQGECEDEAKELIEQIRDLSYDAENRLDEYELLSLHDQGGGLRGFLQSKMPRYVRTPKACRRVMHQMKDIFTRVRSIGDGREMLLQLPLSRTPEQGRSSASTSNAWQDHRGDALLLAQKDLVGIENPKKQLIEWMIEGRPGRQIISVVGMGGLGKTTLVKQAYEDPLVKKHFATRAWVTLSPSSETEGVLSYMLQQITGGRRKPVPEGRRIPVPEGLDDSNRDLLKTLIKNMLQESRTRYLIVLDDVWHLDRWDDVKYVLPNDEQDSRIIITTRKTDLALNACTEFAGEVYNMEPLSDKQAWELFCMKTFKDDSCPLHLETICRSILQTCEGLPLAIVAVSGILATKGQGRIEEWAKVRRSLHGNDGLNKLKKVLSLSFNDLPHYLKSCFLHLSVFPEDHKVERMRLIRLWMAEGFVEPKEGETPEEVAEDYLNDLLNRSLLQVAETTSDGRVQVCRIHHHLQEIGIAKSKERSYTIVRDKQCPEWLDGTRYLSIHKMLEISRQNMNHSELRSLFIFKHDESSINMVLSCDFKLLRVLDFQGAPLKRFPMQVLDMHFLRYLNLRNTGVKTIPKSIGQLQHLETLDLKHSKVTKLPVEIIKLQKLRHLLVYRYEQDSYYHTKHGFKTLAEIGTLQNLQKLCYIVRLCILKLKKEDGKNLCSSIDELTNLLSLSVSAFTDDEEIDLAHLSSPPPLLQRIYLRGCLHTLPHWIANLQSLIILHLRWCELRDDPLIPLRSLPNLVHLELLQAYDWKTLTLTSEGFKKLKILALDHLENLTFIGFKNGAMPCLEKLMISRCELLKNVPSGTEHLTKLKLLEFFVMPDTLIKKLKLDGGWDVKWIERSGEEKSSHARRTDATSSKVSPCWK